MTHSTPGDPDTPADLAADTAPVLVAPGRYAIALPDHWDFALPSGGALTTCALRAAEAALGEPALRFTSSTTVFCTPIQPGPLEAEVVILRRGNAAAQVRVALRSTSPGAAGDAGLELLATFCRERLGPDILGTAFPADVPGPDESEPLLDDHPSNPHRRLRFFRNFECRIGRGDRFWAPGWQAGPARYARWFRYRRPQRDAAGHLDRLALPPIVDTLPPTLVQAVGPSDYRFYAPSLDLTLHVVDDTDREWILVSAEARRARAGWAFGDAEIWDDRGRLIAFVTQAMYIAAVSGAPPIVDASRRRWP
jgi:acyl-CoA thioesterase